MIATSPMSDASESRSDGSVAAQLRLLWRHAPMIAAAMALAGALALGVSLVRPLTYEASATVSVYAARLAEGFLRLPAEGFLPLMESQVVTTEAAKQLSMPVPTVRAAVTIRVVPESNLIAVVARAATPESAARLANVVAAVGVNEANRMSRSDVDVIDAELKAMVDAAEARLKEAEQAYEDYRKTAQYEAVEREIAMLLEQRTDLMQVTVDLEAERARLARAEEEAARQQPLTSLRQSLVDDPAMHQAAKGEAAGRDALTIEMRREVPNEVATRLTEEVAVSRAQVAALEKRRASLAQSAGVAGKSLGRLDELYRRESRLQRLEVELKLAQKAYEDVSAKYHGARLSAMARTPQLRVVDAAIAPDLPRSRYATRNAVFGVAVGALLACAVVILRDALRSA